MQSGQQLQPSKKTLNFSDKEFGRTYLVQSPTFLYARPPQPKSLLNRLLRRTAVTTVSGNIEIVEESEQRANIVWSRLASNTVVLARNLRDRDDVFEVVTYSKKIPGRADMPESGNEITIVNKGYVYADDLQATANQATFIPFTTDLFPNADLIADVKQSTFGDCFLLSTLLAILHKGNGDEFIRNMVVPDGPNHSRVFLYDPDTHERVSIRVENTLHSVNGQSPVQHRAPWVHLIEKAYTALAYKTSPAKSQTHFQHHRTFPSFEAMFGEGDKESFAMQIVTGKSALTVKLPNRRGVAWQCDHMLALSTASLKSSAFINLACVNGLQALDDELTNKSNDSTFSQGRLVKVSKDHTRLKLELILFSSNLDKLEKILKSFMETDKEKFYQFIDSFSNPEATLETKLTYLRANLNTIYAPIARFILDQIDIVKADKQEEILDSFADYLRLFHGLVLQESLPIAKIFKSTTELVVMGVWFQSVGAAKFLELTEQSENLEQVSASFNELCRIAHETGLPKHLLDKMRSSMKSQIGRENSWDGNLGTALYSSTTNAVFAEISTHLKNGNILTAATKATLKNVPGLRPSHAYSIERVVEDARTGLKYVVVRNPWGMVGRKYKKDQQPLTAEERDTKPTFKVEMSDFVKYFADYTVGEQCFKVPRTNSAESNNSNKSVSHALNRETPHLHWKTILHTTLATAVAFGTVGAYVGTAVAAGAAFPTLGLSTIALPLFAVVGFAIGGVVGFTASIAGCFAASIHNNRLSTNGYQLVPQENPDSELRKDKQRLPLGQSESIQLGRKLPPSKLSQNKSGLFAKSGHIDAEKAPKRSRNCCPW